MSRADEVARLADLLQDPDDAALAEIIGSLQSDPSLRDQVLADLEIGEMVSRLVDPSRQNFINDVSRHVRQLQPSEKFVGRVIESRRLALPTRRRLRIGLPVAIAAAAALVLILVSPWNGAHALPFGVIDSARHARIRHLDGTVEPGRGGMPLRLGDQVATGGKDASFAITRADGVRISGGTDVDCGFTDAVRLGLAEGQLRVDVPRRDGPTQERLVVTTESGDVHVIGTRFTISAHARRTYLAMEQGTVRFSNRLGDIAVSAPDCAHATPASAPEIDRLGPPKRIAVEFHGKGEPVAEGAILDSGEEYTVSRGYGWIGPKRGAVVPGEYVNGNRGPHAPVFRGRDTSDNSVDRGLSGGSNHHVETWIMDVANGRYRVTVRVGDSAFPQGPHHVRVQDVQVIDSIMTDEDEHVQRSADVIVRDGRLTMAIGGADGSIRADDYSTDTVITNLVIEPIPDQENAR